MKSKTQKVTFIFLLLLIVASIGTLVAWWALNVYVAQPDDEDIILDVGNAQDVYTDLIIGQAEEKRRIVPIHVKDYMQSTVADDNGHINYAIVPVTFTWNNAQVMSAHHGYNIDDAVSSFLVNLENAFEYSTPTDTDLNRVGKEIDDEGTGLHDLITVNVLKFTGDTGNPVDLIHAALLPSITDFTDRVSSTEEMTDRLEALVDFDFAGKDAGFDEDSHDFAFELKFNQSITLYFVIHIAETSPDHMPWMNNDSRVRVRLTLDIGTNDFGLEWGKITTP